MDELDDLLRPPDAMETDINVGVYRRTAAVLRLRRWRRRVSIGLAGIACFAAGAGALWLATPREDQRAIALEPPIARARPGETDPFRNDPPKRIEQWATLSKGDERGNLFRRAGDGYLVRGDEIAALRCYRNALDASPTELALQANDSWLLMSLKIARQKEKPDARN